MSVFCRVTRREAAAVRRTLNIEEMAPGNPDVAARSSSTNDHSYWHSMQIEHHLCPGRERQIGARALRPGQVTSELVRDCPQRACRRNGYGQHFIAGGRV